jgi:hypothetical protein
MSAVTDNQTFLTNVLGAGNVDFTNAVYGLWVSVFRNVNHSSNGYTYPEPLVGDIMSIDYSLTGKTFTAFNQEGKAPDIRFFITSGVKGSAFYDTNTIAADITDSFISGESPSVIMSGQGFTGDVYRKYEVTGLVNSLVANFQSLSVSGEDWAKTSIGISADSEETEFVDSDYSGYANEVQTRYKFLFTDASNSVQEDLSIFDIPTQIEAGAALRYRISRKSDPLGTYITPQVTADNKMIIDYSQYEDVVPVNVESNVNYNFETDHILRFSQSSLESIRDGNITSLGVGEGDGITGLRVSNDNDNGNFAFTILPSGGESFDDLYKIDFSIDKFKETERTGVDGYVLTGIVTGGVTGTIDLVSGSKVYPRNIQSNSYDQSYLRELANLSELEYNEAVVQGDDAVEPAESDTSTFAKAINDYYQQLARLLSDEDDPKPVNDDPDKVSKYSVDQEENVEQYIENNSNGLLKFVLPTLSLPKNTIDKGYYSDYLNSGESYIALPLVEYSADPSFVYYGNQFGQLGYYINNGLRSPINSTVGGVSIGATGLCVGDSAIYSNASSDTISFYNGRDLNIQADGVIKKDNFTKISKWSSTVNYFYAKNPLYSFDIYPQNSDESNRKAFSNALGQAAGLLSQGTGEFLDKQPRLFLEREIYVEEYDENQAQLATESFKPSVDNTADVELTTFANEKLHSIQTYANDSSYQNFLVSSDHEEKIKFKSFIPYKNASNVQNNFYEYIENSGISRLYSKSANASVSDFQIARLEYVTGDSFSYADLSSNYVVWDGTPTSGNIIIDAYTEAEDITTNAYHLYGYNASNQSSDLSFIKQNVTINSSNEVPVPDSFDSFCVLKFPKKSFTKQEYYIQEDDSRYLAYNFSLLQNNTTQLPPEKAFFNIQIYDYTVAETEKNNCWVTNKDNPYNDDFFGADNIYGNTIPRFFEDAVDNEDKRKALELLDYPNGPASSKNFEGIPVLNEPTIINSLTDGTIKNSIKVTEEGGRFYENSNDFMLDFNVGGKIVKGLGLNSNVPRKFTDTKRLKITRIKYNIYSKDLVILGDAGFQYSVDLNTAWEYKLQYKLKTSNNWTELNSSTALTNSDLQTTSEFLNPFFYISRDLSKQAYLSTVAFRTNIPRFLDDSNYEFRIFKYEKLVSPFNSVDIINKTNFLPIDVSWTKNNTAEYYNIYQVDSGNNQTLLETVPASEASSYSLPRVKQSYFDLGPANFSVGSGYYDILVSGVNPAVDTSDTPVSSIFSDFKVGDDINGEQYKVSVTENNANYNNQYSAVSNVSYSPVIDFRNNEFKQSPFTLDQKYDNYYFITSGQDATLGSVSDTFEAYVINTGSSCNLAGESNVHAGSGVYVNGSTSSIITFTEADSFEVFIDANVFKSFISLSSNAFTNSTLINDEEVFIVNDSDSSIDFTFNNNGPTTKTIPANQTSNFYYDGSAIQDGISYLNVDQNLTTLETSFRTVNLNFSNLTVTSDVENLPIYNFAKTSLSVNNAASIPADTLALVTKSGASVSTTEISPFDYTKIYFEGDEEDPSNYVLVDDTDIIISQFSANNERDYFFIVYQGLRDLNIRIINGASIQTIPKEYRSFKLNVYKISGVIYYRLTLPNSNSELNLSGDREQMIVLKQKPINSKLQYSEDVLINLGGADKILKTNSFVYASNKSTSNLEVGNLSLAQNQLCRITPEKTGNSIQFQVSLIENKKLFFDFDKYADFSSAGNINLFNLRFNSAELKVSASSVSGSCFLILKNTFASNELVNVKLKESNIYRLSGANDSASVSEPAFANSEDSVFENIYDSDSDYNFIYIDDDNLNNITVRDSFDRKIDSFDRKIERKGFIVSKTSRKLNSRSFDNIYNFNLNKEQVFTYKFDQGVTPDGSLSVKNKKVDFNILNENSIKSISLTGQIINSGAYYVNLTLSSISINSNIIKKNRIMDGANNYYPVYNEEEFFIAKNKNEIEGVRKYQSSNTYYYEIDSNCDVEKVVWKTPTSSNFIIRNTSSRVVKIVDITAVTAEKDLSPNEEIEINTTPVVGPRSFTAVPEGILPLKINSSNQEKEIESDHPVAKTQDTISNLLNKDGLISVDLNAPILTDNSNWFCFGLSLGSDNNPLQGNILNDLYLKVYVDGEELGYGQVNYEGNEEFVNFNRLKRVNFDLGKIFQNDNSFTGDVEIIPFYRELVTYSLPNLTTNTISDGKKIVFVNLVQCNVDAGNTDADNKIFNGQSEIAIRNLNDVEIFTKTGSSWSREGAAENIPTVQNLHASPKQVSGVNFSTGAVSQTGNEILEINNIDTLRVTLDSFEKGDFGNFYLYNGSGIDYINLIISNRFPARYAIGSFSRMEFDGSSYRVKPILYSQKDQYIDIDYITNPENIPAEDNGFYLDDYNDKDWEETYGSLPVGTVFKIRNTLRKKTSNSEYPYHATDLGVVNPSSDGATSVLRVDKLINNSDKFFMYGSSVRNALGQSFDTYSLILEGLSNINSGSFYIFNNTDGNLLVEIGEGQIQIPEFAMYEINANSMIPFETRRKSEYFISDNQLSNNNFLIKSNLNVTKFSLPTYSITDNSVQVKTKAGYKETLLTVNAPNLDKLDFTVFYYDTDDALKAKVSVFNQTGFDFRTFNEAQATSFNSKIFNAVLAGQIPLLKPSYEVTSAGHYVMSNTQASFYIQSLTSNDYFLINNTTQDIQVKVGNTDKTLYRNNVLILNASKNERYLKKGKNEDEFYAVFNPKTKISTQREIANVFDLETYSEVEQIYNSDFISIQSYISLYSKEGATDRINLNKNQYYGGADIPTDTVSNVIAYELGIGHETIYKFNFIDPSSNFYTLPGIVAGEKYLVEADNDLLLNQSIIDQLSDKDKLIGQVKYMGRIYKNGETFNGEASPWYEVNYPDYVKVYKVIEEFPEGFSTQEWKDSVGEEYNGLTVDDVARAEAGEVVSDPLALFKEKINNDLPSTLTEIGDTETTIAWIPDGETAFWLSDSYTQNNWIVQEVLTGPEDSKELILDNNNKLLFKKCKMETKSLRSPVSNFSYSYYSALQDRTFLSEGGDATVGFDYNLTPNQKRTFKNLTNAEYNKSDSINSLGEEYKLASIPVASIFPSPGQASQLEGTKVEIAIRINKINEMPKLELEDFSQNGIVKLLNSEP